MHSDETRDALRAIAESLCGRRVDSVAPAASGGNSRIYRARCGRDDFALKCYPPRGQDPRERANTEFKALRFMERHCPGRAPRAYAVDAEGGYLLLEWVEGSRVSEVVSADVDSAVAFLGALFEASTDPDARDLPYASEACLSGEEVVRQLLDRESRLRAMASDQRVLIEFLDHEFAPARERLVEQARAGSVRAGIDFPAELEPAARALVPSDFGFHNALRTANGALIFVDHEYFGWDDPVKVTADFLLHPATPLACDMADRFWRGVSALRENDKSFRVRLKLLYPLFGVRWCLILLNEFLPERWANRSFAGASRHWESVKLEQLRRSRDLLEKVGPGSPDFRQ
jgi:hypothetical protein